MRSVQRYTTGGPRWWFVPLLLTFLVLSGCGLRSLFGGGSASSVNPADATVTAVVTQSAGQPNCQPQVSTTVDGQAQALGKMGKSVVVFTGTCWIVGSTVTLGVIDHSTAGTPTIQPLDQSGTTTPVSAQVHSDGTFSITLPLANSLSPYIWDSRLPFVVQEDGFVQFAATSIEVSSS